VERGDGGRLHHLFPPLRDTSVISRLRSTTPYPRPPSRTKNTSHSLTLDLNSNLCDNMKLGRI